MPYFKNPETGNVGEIPREREEEALADGMVPVTRMKNPETGGVGWVESARAREALDDGLEIVSAIDEPIEISEGEAATRGFAQGATFGLADELAAGGQALKRKITGESTQPLADEYERLLAQYNEMNQSAQQQNPWSYGAGNVAGNIGVSAPLGGVAAGKLAPMVAGSASKYAHALPLAVGGTVSGGLSGIESGTPIESAMIGGLTGGSLPVAGTVLGGVSKAAGSFAGKLAKNVEQIGGTGEGVTSGLVKTIPVDLMGGGGLATSTYLGSKAAEPMFKTTASGLDKFSQFLQPTIAKQTAEETTKGLMTGLPQTIVKDTTREFGEGAFTKATERAGTVPGIFSSLKNYLSSEEKQKVAENAYSTGDMEQSNPYSKE